MALDAFGLASKIAEARRRCGLTQEELAREVGLDRSAVAKIETGARRVSALELALIAAALNERVEWFLSEPVPAIVSHRNMLDPGQPSPAIDAAIERFARSCEFLAKEDAGMRKRLARLPRLEESFDSDGMERLAQQARRLLGVRPDEPLHELDFKLAQLGFLTWAVELGSDSADAGSVLLPEGGLAVVNASFDTGRRRLALAHEFGHALLADEYTVDWRVDAGQGAKEAAIDRFARALLIPAVAVEEGWTRWVAEHGVRAAAVRTASHFRVDMATLARRLKELGLLTDEDVALVRSTRTTKADILEHNLVPADELPPNHLSQEYEKAVLRVFRKEIVGEDRALDLLMDAWNSEDLPALPVRKEAEIWGFVG